MSDGDKSARERVHLHATESCSKSLSLPFSCTSDVVPLECRMEPIVPLSRPRPTIGLPHTHGQELVIAKGLEKNLSRRSIRAKSDSRIFMFAPTSVAFLNDKRGASHMSRDLCSILQLPTSSQSHEHITVLSSQAALGSHHPRITLLLPAAEVLYLARCFCSCLFIEHRVDGGLFTCTESYQRSYP